MNEMNDKSKIVCNKHNKKEEKFFKEDVSYCVDYENWNNLVGYATITKHGFVTRDEAVDFIIRTITDGCKITEDGEKLSFDKSINNTIGHLKKEQNGLEVPTTIKGLKAFVKNGNKAIVLWKGYNYKSTYTFDIVNYPKHFYGYKINEVDSCINNNFFKFEDYIRKNFQDYNIIKHQNSIYIGMFTDLEVDLNPQLTKYLESLKTINDDDKPVFIKRKDGFDFYSVSNKYSNKYIVKR